jgi:hypothetical protein
LWWRPLGGTLVSDPASSSLFFWYCLKSNDYQSEMEMMCLSFVLHHSIAIDFQMNFRFYLDHIHWLFFYQKRPEHFTIYLNFKVISVWCIAWNLSCLSHSMSMGTWVLDEIKNSKNARRSSVRAVHFPAPWLPYLRTLDQNCFGPIS